MASQRTTVACLLSVAMVFVVIPMGESFKHPNIVFILTDDQDLVLGGMDPMQKTINLIGNQGITFDNAFVSVPICCPSRASILTGKYQHNHHTFNNSVEGGCSSSTWQQQQEAKAFPVYLKQQGYTTFFAGKYLNRYGFHDVGGTKHVPPGWDWWYGLVGNSVYYDYTLSVNGTREVHGNDYLQDYLTDLINRKGQEFLNMQHANSPPFFMMLSTPACHEPFPPAPHYAHYYSDARAPRQHGSFDVKAQDKHWLLEQPIVPMPNTTLDLVDDFFQNRLRTLLSVDDMVEDVYNLLRSKNMLDNTYLFFSSDHGYHLGQFGLPYDKREPYEFDVRVPMMVKGPGIQPGMVSKESPMNIDLGPTFISLAGGTIPSDMDGKSLEPLWLDADESRGFRPNVLIEYSGEEKLNIRGCPQWEGQRLFNCNPKAQCVCEDAHNNTWACVRSASGHQVYKYCQFHDDEQFVELYELESDPWELTNLAKTADPVLLNAMKSQLDVMVSCSGASCNTQKIKFKKILKEGKPKGQGKKDDEKKWKKKKKRKGDKDTFGQDLDGIVQFSMEE